MMNIYKNLIENYRGCEKDDYNLMVEINSLWLKESVHIPSSLHRQLGLMFKGFLFRDVHRATAVGDYYEADFYFDFDSGVWTAIEALPNEIRTRGYGTFYALWEQWIKWCKYVDYKVERRILVPKEYTSQWR